MDLVNPSVAGGIFFSSESACGFKKKFFFFFLVWGLFQSSPPPSGTVYCLCSKIRNPILLSPPPQAFRSQQIVCSVHLTLPVRRRYIHRCRQPNVDASPYSKAIPASTPTTQPSCLSHLTIAPAPVNGVGVREVTVALIEVLGSVRVGVGAVGCPLLVSTVIGGGGFWVGRMGCSVSVTVAISF